MFARLERHFQRENKWNTLDNAYVNFTHWVPVSGDHDSAAFTKRGFYGSWLRHQAYCFTSSNFRAIDLIIPMAFRSKIEGDDTLDEDSMSHIVVSVKNPENPHDGITMPFLSKEAVEGVPSGGTFTKCSSTLAIRLTLYSLQFINPKGPPGANASSDHGWIEATPDKPYMLSH